MRGEGGTPIPRAGDRSLAPPRQALYSAPRGAQELPHPAQPAVWVLVLCFLFCFFTTTVITSVPREACAEWLVDVCFLI